MLDLVCALLNNNRIQVQSTDTYLLTEVFSDNLLDLLHAALRSSAVKHLQRGCVFLRKQVVQSTKVLAYLDESATIGTA